MLNRRQLEAEEVARREQRKDWDRADVEGEARGWTLEERQARARSLRRRYVEERRDGFGV